MDLPKRKQNRLAEYDYSTPSAYFITICTKNRKNLFWMIAPTISTVVRLMKGTVSKQAGFAIWQKGFYDHVIRNDNDYRDIWNYIEGNPGKWTEDKLYIPPW